MDIKKHFNSISDPRVVGRTEHLLTDIIGLTLIAVIAGCEEWDEIEDFGKSKEAELRHYLEFPNGVPSHDTLSRVFSMIKPQEFENCFIEWVKATFSLSDNRIINIDGKSNRRSGDKRKGKKMLHMVSAWASNLQIVLAQRKVDDKSNEITAIPELLKLIDIKGSIVTIDAIGTQKEIAEKIVKEDADYILPVKGNQQELMEQIKTAFKVQTPQSADVTEEKDHGRIETRKCSVLNDLKFVDEAEKWKKSKTVIKMERTRTINEHTTNETVFYISSLQTNAATMNKFIRSHWGIENSLHWMLDVQFKEDDCRKRKQHSAENFSIIRRMALNILKSCKTDKRSIHRRRKMAAYDFRYLCNLLKI
jgi:predicted transposase YbfD/YdcC